ncbi:anti-sigma factor [Quadrisphaera sp. KR29]|uniref:anti-sigma factor n=1 Tax=Quadrisphaera sp. KR29 TaxID=3461391 RepID=UPI004044CD1C
MAPPEQPRAAMPPGEDRHPATDELAMVAVAPDDERLERVRGHVGTCAACSEEVAHLSAALAPGTDGPARRLPPPAVWAGIAAATGVRTAPDEAAVLRSLDDDAGVEAALTGAGGARGGELRDLATSPTGAVASGPVQAGSVRAGSGQAPPERTGPARREAGGPLAVVPAQRSRQRWSTPVLLGAAGLALVVGATSGALVASRTREPVVAGGPGAGAVVVSTAQLRPLEPGQGRWSGTAEVVATGDEARGRRVLVTTDGLPAVEGAAYEVWLLDTATGGVVSLGALADGHSPQGGYVLPDGVDLERFSEVDVSAEPLDGQAAHSGVSELRGPLTAEGAGATVSA